MNIAKIETFAVRIPSKQGTQSDASAWGDGHLPAADCAGASPRLAVDELPAEIARQDGALVRFRRQERPAKLPSEPSSDRSEVRIRSFVLAFVGMLCATFIGFVSEIRPLDPSSPDHGYDEALGTQTSSLSSANFPRNGSDEGAEIFAGAKGGKERLGVRATVGCVDASLNASLCPKTGGGGHVD